MTTWRVVALGVVLGVVMGAIVVAFALATDPPDVVDAADRGAPVDRGTPGLAAALEAAPSSGRSAPRRPPEERARERRALRIIAAWSRRRARAWASTSAGRVRALYATPSAAGAELALWRSYRRRDLRVEGLRSQVLAIRVLSASARRLAVVIDERSASGVVVGSDAVRRVALPQDKVDRRRVVLVLGPDAVWRVERISERGPPR